MNFQIRISLALLFSAWMAASACGQFPWSGGKNAAPEARKTGSITWKSDLPEALKLAREQRKLVFLHFSGTHCPPCRKLEDNVLNRNDVAVTMLSRFVPVFIVVEEAENLVERFHVQSWPTDVILDADGREIARHVSPQNPQEFIKRISTISAKHHAGQSVTLANVRAAVASDVTESSGPVQQTAGDDRLATPTQPPRAESKVVRNPHTPDSRLPPIVARNNKAKKALVRSGDREDEGFSPPSERRKPVIVRKADEPKQVAALDKSVEDPSDTDMANDEPAAEANAEGDVAPWRKNLIAKKAAKKFEVAKEPEAEEVPAEEQAEEMETAPDEAAAEKTEEPAAEAQSEGEPEPKSEKTTEEKVPEEAKSAEEEPVADANKSEKPVEQEVTDELPAPRSRFGATKAEEGPAEETPAAEPTTEAPAKPEEEASEETEAPDTAETASEEPAPKIETTKPEAAAQESKEPARPKSRFSGGDDEEAKSEEESPAATESGEPAEEAAVEPDVKEEAVKQEAASPAEEKTEEEAPKATEENTEAVEAMPESEATEEAPPQSEKAPVEETAKKPAPKAAAKKAKKPVEAPSEEPEGDEAADEPAESARPRGLAKIARSGKYVLGGHCCVTLLENETLKKGNPKLGAIHRGRIYLFASADARKKFLGNPDDYSPMLTGYDPVLYADNGELVDGSAEILAKLHDGRVVTFSSEETYKRFAADYKKLREKSPYVEATRSAMKETNGGRHFR